MKKETNSFRNIKQLKFRKSFINSSISTLLPRRRVEILLFINDVPCRCFICKPSVKEEVEYKTDDIHILSLAKYG